jgi:hypothetical protein
MQKSMRKRKQGNLAIPYSKDKSAGKARVTTNKAFMKRVIDGIKQGDINEART